MLAAVINKSDNIDERIWTTLQEVSAARGHSEEVLTVNIWISKVRFITQFCVL